MEKVKTEIPTRFLEQETLRVIIKSRDLEAPKEIQRQVFKLRSAEGIYESKLLLKK